MVCEEEGRLSPPKITLEDYFGRFTVLPGEASQPSSQTRENAITLLARVNALLAVIDLPEAIDPRVTSGWRPAWHNATIANAAPKSKHISGEAIDIADPEGALDNHLFDFRTLLSEHGLWMEHPSATKGWTHLQCVPPRSGNRVFFP